MIADADPLDRVAGVRVALAILVLVATVAVALSAGTRLAQIPGYLVLAGFDVLRNPLAPGLSGWPFTVAFVLYLYALAVVLGNVAAEGVRRVRDRD